METGVGAGGKRFVDNPHLLNVLHVNHSQDLLLDFFMNLVKESKEKYDVLYTRMKNMVKQ